MINTLERRRIDESPYFVSGSRKEKETVDGHTSYHYMDLPHTRLHYVKCGEGPPLIMVPATISDIASWLPLAQLLGRYFTTYFFELPGHGKSTPFKSRFSSDLVAETVEAFVDRLGCRRITLMGFSFGGILARKVLMRLQDRVDRVILFAPATTRHALCIPAGRIVCIRILLAVLHQRWLCRAVVNLIQSRLVGTRLIALLRRLGKIEENVPLENRLMAISPVTLQVLVDQLREVFEHDIKPLEVPFQPPVYFGMSVNDPLLDFEKTLEIVESQFAQVHIQRFDFPYHQPPGKPSTASLAREFDHFFQDILK
ncbi:MAG: alpha/beta fold hydrolase [Anaerolineae bacterium]|nr:alpha/beta fold hydrolase [Anaerolineae bacterium]